MKQETFTRDEVITILIGVFKTLNKNPELSKVESKESIYVRAVGTLHMYELAKIIKGESHDRDNTQSRN